MYKKSNISLFIFSSLLLHVLFITRYQQQNISAFENNNNSTSLSLTNTVLRLSFISESKEQPKDSTTDEVKKNKPVYESNILLDKSALEIVENDKQNQRQDSRPASFNVEKNVFLERVLTAIEGNKFYPSLARKRNMQEIIEVSFDLLESGDVKNIVITGNYKILRHAARTAVLKARPFVTFPSGIDFPFNIQYSMEFKLE